MPILFDSSLIVKTLIREPGSEAAIRVMATNSENIIAPVLLKAEICNAIYKKAKNNFISFSDASEILALFLNLTAIEYVESDKLYHLALKICAEISHNSVYDCLFLALALENNCKLCTADDEFIKKAGRYKENLLGLKDV